MSETTKDGPSGPVNAPVRPRWIWSGVALSLGGLVLIGAGLVLRSWPAAGGGVTLIVVGLGLSWAGGVLWDATSGISPADEVRAVRDGEVRQGVKPGTQVNPSAARAEARRASRVTRVTHEPKASTSRSTALRWAPVAGWMLLLAAAVLLVSQWELVGHTATGRRNSYRDTVAIIVFGLSGGATRVHARAAPHHQRCSRPHRRRPGDRECPSSSRPRGPGRGRSDNGYNSDLLSPGRPGHRVLDVDRSKEPGLTPQGVDLPW